LPNGKCAITLRAIRQAKIKAVLYLRCSTVGQVVDGVSLDLQRSRGEAWALANGYEVEAVYADEGISGKKASNRPGLASALDHVCRTRGALVVYSLSRLARSTKDALAISERLSKVGADLVSLSEKIDTTSAAGKMVFRMLAVLAEFERDLVSERTKAALALKKSRGERVGQIPFGFELGEDGSTLVPSGREQATLAELRRLRAAGWTWKRIAHDLNVRGLRTKSGRDWTLFMARKVGRTA
jgi:site-specific DNA recombinase